MAIDLINNETLNLTRPLVEAFAKLPPLPGERRLKPDRVKELRGYVIDGTFLRVDWVIAIDMNTGQKYRVNGQHSSRMLMQLSDEEFPVGLKAIIQTYSVETEVDKVVLFKSIDTSKSVRTSEDRMNYYKDAHPELAKLTVEFLVEVGTGLRAYNANGGGGVLYERDSYGQYFVDKDARQFALWLWSFYGKEGTGFENVKRPAKHVSMMKRPGVIAEMYTDWLQSHVVAQEFWSFALCENHPDPEHLSRKMIDDLRKWPGKKTTIRDYKNCQELVAKYWQRYLKTRRSSISEAMKRSKLDTRIDSADSAGLR